jgi:CRISPR-associated endonuclease/helicase Cas3
MEGSWNLLLSSAGSARIFNSHEINASRRCTLIGSVIILSKSRNHRYLWSPLAQISRGYRAANQANRLSLTVHFWAKTISTAEGQVLPGISVYGHCLNVGCIAEKLISFLPDGAQRLLPPGSATLAALHDIGKITLGFQAKCPAWLRESKLDTEAQLRSYHSNSDHALASQFFVQEQLARAHLWAVAVGAHHGKPKGRTVRTPLEPLADWAENERKVCSQILIRRFGLLPDQPPDGKFGGHHSDLWLLAGLISVADWIGSNEFFFPAEIEQPVDVANDIANRAVSQIGWPGGRLLSKPFEQTFGFSPNAVQNAVVDSATAPGLIIVEAPMGWGKTEAALAAAQRLIASGANHGLYFALPTQVTSNRIHLRVARFMQNALAGDAHLRLAHGHSWLHEKFNFRISPAFIGDSGKYENQDETAQDARSWFASAKHALLAPYGVGTIDQALQGMVAVKHFFVRRFALAGKVVILDEIHSYDVYTGTLVTALVRELLHLGCTVIVLSATLTGERRRELLEATGSREEGAPSSYPLITCARRDALAVQIAPETSTSKKIHLRAEPMDEDTVIAELIARAEDGQNVLWIRNTVVEAQNAFRLIRGDTPVGETPDDQIKLGLLHSRFPLSRRQELEAFWLDRLGRDRPAHGPGSILVATQVVEQSVDIDLDFIVSDLAPTDMLFQRMGRLWRHPRAQRAAIHPEFWIRLPILPTEPASNVASFKKALGRSARVYAPWVLLRAASVFANRTFVTLPDDLRPLLEATYAAPRDDEPSAWHALHVELEEEKRQLTTNAAAAMLVLGRPALTVDESSDQALTRRKGPPTVTVALLTSIEMLSGGRARLTAIDGAITTVSEYDWQIGAARFLHQWIVRVPRWQVPANAPCPRWLALHISGKATFACVQDDGRLLFGDITSVACYHTDFGVFAEKTAQPAQLLNQWNDDDEFDN